MRQMWECLHCCFLLRVVERTSFFWGICITPFMSTEIIIKHLRNNMVPFVCTSNKCSGSNSEGSVTTCINKVNIWIHVNKPNADPSMHSCYYPDHQNLNRDTDYSYFKKQTHTKAVASLLSCWTSWRTSSHLIHFKQLYCRMQTCGKGKWSKMC